MSYGVALALVLLAPFGVYHSIVQPYILGWLWGYYLPIGFIGLAFGILVVLYPKLTFIRTRLRLNSLMIIVGILLLVSAYLTPETYFVNMLHGTNFSYGQIDFDYPFGYLVVLTLALFSIAGGTVMRMQRRWGEAI